MRIDPEKSSPWMIEFHKQVLRGKHVLLYGNIADQFLLNGEYLSLMGFLGKYLHETGYELISRYDIVDGLQLANPPAMEARFNEILRSALGGEAAQVAPREGTEGQQAPPRRIPQARGASPLGSLRPPDQAFAAMRTVLGQSRTSAAMIANFCDLLTGHPDHLTDAERAILLQMKKTLHNASYLGEGPLAGRPNLLVLVAGQLGKVPSWFYQENPLLALVQVPRPGWKERRSFLISFLQQFHEGNRLALPQAEEVAREFSDLTDGLTAWDLEALRRTSRAEQMPISRPRALVDYYKYGRRDDPWEQLDQARVRAAQEQMEKRVIGQPVAIGAVVRMLLSARVGISLSEVTARAGKPKGTFFFVGPTGVGKTELAKALTGVIFGDDTAFARFDMSEYAEQHAAEKLTGSPPGYVGYEEGGHLTNRVRERPFSVLLFDEIEKAHGRVMDKFLQVLEDGRLTDGKGQTAYFSQSVIIFTSNIGSDSLNLVETPGSELLPYERVREHYLTAVRNHFTRPPSQGGLGRPELLNRLGDNVLVFDLLRPQFVEGISRKFLNLLAAAAQEKRELKLTFPGDESITMIRRRMESGDNLLYGGRRIKSLLETYVERPLNHWIFFNDPPPGTTLALTVAEDQTLRINGRATG
jgi:hypothetical protein